MSKHASHIDTINGDLVEVVLNAPFCTIVDGSNFKKGNDVKRYCASEASQYCKIVGDQVWASQREGLLLFAFIDQHLDQWSLGDSNCMIYLPLDEHIYAVEVNEFGTCAAGSEQILTIEEALQDQALPVYVLEGGTLSLHFDDKAPFDIKDHDLQVRRINKELVKHRYFTSPHYAVVGALTVLGVFALLQVPRIIDSQNTEPVTVAPVILPKGSDIAVSQLKEIDRAIGELGFFLEKGLTTFSYDTQQGITLQGTYPDSTKMLQLMQQSELAGLNLTITGAGWTINKYPQVPPRETFNLGSFEAAYLRVQQAAEQYGFNAAISAPSTQGNRQTVSIELTRELFAKPPLAGVASMLEGRAISLNSLNINFEDYQHSYVRMILDIAGKAE